MAIGALVVRLQCNMLLNDYFDLPRPPFLMKKYSKNALEYIYKMTFMSYLFLHSMHLDINNINYKTSTRMIRSKSNFFFVPPYFPSLLEEWEHLLREAEGSVEIDTQGGFRLPLEWSRVSAFEGYRAIVHEYVAFRPVFRRELLHKAVTGPRIIPQL